jgi:hypothetical protein
MNCDECVANEGRNCADCATRLLNNAGFLWNGTPITPNSHHRLPKEERREQNLRRMEINHNQRLIGSFVSLEELRPDAKVFIPGFA